MTPAAPVLNFGSLMRLPRALPLFAAAFALAAGAVPALAGDLGFGGGGLEGRIPASALARPMTWFDPSRLRLATTVSVGTGFGTGTSGLQTTRLSYQFQAPMWMSVSVGNAFGGGRGRDGHAFFLEGLDFAWRPSPSMMFQFSYQDVRSPLQLRDSRFGFPGEYLGH